MRGYAEDCRASSTRRAYLSNFSSFEAWCATQNLIAMPAKPSVLAGYLSALAASGRKVKTIERALSGIGHAIVSGATSGRVPMAVAAVMGGICYRIGAPPSQKSPVDDHELAALLGTLDGGLVGLRDRALLMLGWWGRSDARRWSLSTFRDVARTREGLPVTPRRSKTDQEGQGPSAASPSPGALRSAPYGRSTSGSRPPA